MDKSYLLLTGECSQRIPLMPLSWFVLSMLYFCDTHIVLNPFHYVDKTYIIWYENKMIAV